MWKPSRVAELSDTDRVSQFRTAIKTTIGKMDPKPSVLLVGACAGVYGSAALAAGARELVVLDPDERACREAEHVLRERFADRAGDWSVVCSTTVGYERAPAAPFDLSIMNVLGGNPIDGDLIPQAFELKRRGVVAEEGRFIPHEISVTLCLYEVPLMSTGHVSV